MLLLMSAYAKATFSFPAIFSIAFSFFRQVDVKASTGVVLSLPLLIHMRSGLPGREPDDHHTLDRVPISVFLGTHAMGSVDCSIQVDVSVQLGDLLFHLLQAGVGVFRSLS